MIKYLKYFIKYVLILFCSKSLLKLLLIYIGFVNTHDLIIESTLQCGRNRKQDYREKCEDEMIKDKKII